MGVDLAVYRVRIGQFVPRSPVDIVSNTGYLLKAIASVRGGLARHDGLNSKGAVTFINLLLRAQGIEPNPGPGNPEKKSQEQIPDEQTDHNEDVSTPVGNNTTPVRADMINEIGESVPSVSNPPHTGSDQVDECAGAVAIPGLPSGAIANPTAVQASNTNPLSTSMAKQIVESCLSVSNPRHSGSGQEDECAGAIAIPGSSSGAIVNPTIVQQINVVNVANMNVRKAENVSAGDQIINYPAPVSNNEDETTRKQRKRSQGQVSDDEDEDIPKQNKKRPKGQETDNRDEDTPRQKKKRPKGQEVDNEDEDIPKQKKKRLKDHETDNEGGGISKQKKKSPKRILLEENAETMLERHDKETASLLVTRTGAEAAVIKCLKNYNMVIIAGVTGEGKTTLGREICKKLKDGSLDNDIKPKTPVLMTDSKDWNDVVDDKADIVVFVDDIFGQTNYQAVLLEGWKSLFNRILQCLHEKHVCLVVTSRTHILKDARRESGVLPEMISDHILTDKKTVDLTDDQKLTSDELVRIYENHSRQRQVDRDRFSSIPVIPIRGFPSNISLGFAQICKLFFNNESLFEKGERFFTSPDRILSEEIARMRQTEPHKYLALVYCFFRDAAVDSDELSPFNISGEDHDTLKKYAEACGVRSTDNVLALLKNGLDALDGTYLTKQDTVYTFGHQSIADSVSILFGKENPGMILEKCSNRVILELVDVSKSQQTDICTLHVSRKNFDYLAKRIYKMITEADVFNRITLGSFPRFQNEQLADCLFEYITKNGGERKFHRAHLGDRFSSNRSLLESCANNVFFLKSLFKYKIDEFIVKESGILFFTRTLQRTLLRSLEHKNKESLSFLLANGAFLTEKCLHIAIGANDVDLARIVLYGNIWTKSEVSRCTDEKTPENFREMLQKDINVFNVDKIRNQYFTQKMYAKKEDADISSMNTYHMMAAVEDMDFETLHTIFQCPEFKDHQNRLIKTILDSKHKRLSDAIAIKRMTNQIDGTVVRHALHHCDLDMFRFFLFSSNVSKAQLTAMLSEAIHLNKEDKIEILIKAGGQPSLDDFIAKAGTVCMGVEDVVATIMEARTWKSAQLARVLDAAVRSGKQATMKVLIKGGAQFAEDALVNVSKRQNDPLKKLTTPIEELLFVLRNIKLQEALKFVPLTVGYVFSKHEWSEYQITDAITAALESGSFHTVKFLKSKGGTFCNNALLAAVRRPHETLDMVKFVLESREWSVDQLNDALHLAIVLCRSKVVLHLKKNSGAQFNDPSLKNILQWKVEHHVQLKLLEHILKSRTWSQPLLDEALLIACKSNSLAICTFLKFMELRPGMIRDVLLGLQGMKHLKKETIQQLKDNRMDDDLVFVLSTEVREGHTEIVEHLICELGISCDSHCLLYAMDNSQNYSNYDRLKMVRLVRESKSWSDELLTKALDKAVRLGYSDVILYLHSHGAKFGDSSLEYAMMYKNRGYSPYDLVTYIMKSRDYNKEQLNRALTKSVEIGHYQLMTLFHDKGAGFADKCLQDSIHKKWIPSDRLPAVKFILNARQWDSEEKNDALYRAVQFGDVSVISCLLKGGGEVSKQCLFHILEKKCKPSHRLCIVKTLLSTRGSLSHQCLEEAGEKAKQLSEPKLEAFIQQCII